MKWSKKVALTERSHSESLTVFFPLSLSGFSCSYNSQRKKQKKNLTSYKEVRLKLGDLYFPSLERKIIRIFTADAKQDT